MDRVFEAYNGVGGFSAEFMRKTRERLHWTCSQVQGRNVLDVGCSQGAGPLLLGGMGFRVEGVDVNAQAIEFAKARLAEASEEVRRNVAFRNASFIEYAPPDGVQFDTVVMGEVLEHLVRPSTFLQRAFELMKVGGRIIVTVPFGINDDPDHRQTFYLTGIYQLMFPYFEIEIVKFFGCWIGLVGVRRAERTDMSPTVATDLFVQAEEAFNKIERPLIDTRSRVNVLTKQLAEERKKTADLTAKVTVLEARLAAHEEQAPRVDVVVAEDEVHALRTSLEVERKSKEAQIEQITFLKAALQMASGQKPDAANETRLLEYSREVRELRTELDAKRDEIVTRAEAQGRVSAELAAAVAEVKNLQGELTAKQGALSVCESNLRAEQERSRTLIAQYDTTEKVLLATEARLKDAVSELDSRVHTLAARDKELSAVRDEVSRLGAEVAELQLELEAERAKAAVVQTDCNVAQKKVAALEKDSAANLAQSKKGADEARRLQQLLAAVQAERAELDKRLQGEIAWSKRHRLETEARVRALEKDAAAARAQAETLRREGAQRERTLRGCERDLRKVTAAYDKLSKSKLGRLTLAYWRKKDRFLGRDGRGK